MTNNEYLKEFKGRIESMDDYIACILGKFPCLKAMKMKKTYGTSVKEATEHEIIECQEVVKKEVMAAMFLHGLDEFLYGPLKSTLAQHMSMGMNWYSPSLKKDMNTINTYNKTSRGQQETKMVQGATNNNIEIFFAQSSKSDKSDQDLSHITYFHYGMKGHYVKDCPKRKNYVQTMVHCNVSSSTTNRRECLASFGYDTIQMEFQI